MASMPLPAPKDLTSTVLRTDFSDDAAWSAVQAAIDAADGSPHATFVSDPRFTDVSIQMLIEEEDATGKDDKLTYVFLVDATTVADPSSPLWLSISTTDLDGRSGSRPGGTPRFPPT